MLPGQAQGGPGVRRKKKANRERHQTPEFGSSHHIGLSPTLGHWTWGARGSWGGRTALGPADSFEPELSSKQARFPQLRCWLAREGTRCWREGPSCVACGDYTVDPGKHVGQNWECVPCLYILNF